MFEATKINVWDRANQDSVGLAKFYDINKSNYQWAEKARIDEVKIGTNDKKLAEKIYKFVSKGDVSKLDEKFNKKTKVVDIQHVEFEKNSKDIGDIEWKTGAMTPLILDPGKVTYSFKKVQKLVPAKIKTLAEARGYVVADYQDYLEKQWIESLGKEFNVVIYKDTVHQLKK